MTASFRLLLGLAALLTIALLCGAQDTTNTTSQDVSRDRLVFGAPFCSCDVVENACDASCCCDPDCVVAASPQQPCATAHRVYSCGSPRSEQASHLWYPLRDVLCIVRDNEPYIGPLRLPPTQAEQATTQFLPPREAAVAAPADTAQDQQPETPTALYREGDPLFALRAGQEEARPIKLPTSIAGATACSVLTAVAFGTNSSSACFQRIRSEEELDGLCSTTLNATFYTEQWGLIFQGDSKHVAVQVVNSSNMEAEAVPSALLVAGSASPRAPSTVCNGAIEAVHLTIVHRNGNVSRASLQFEYAFQVPSSPELGQEGLAVGNLFSLSLSIAFVEESPRIERSGNPGYIVGRPLVFKTPGPRFSLITGATMAANECTASDQHESPRFGIATTSQCYRTINLSESESCRDVRRAMLQWFGLDLDSIRGLSSDAMIGRYGDSDPSTSPDWIPLVVSPLVQSPYNTQALCTVPTGLHLEVVSTIQGTTSSPQGIVVGAKLTFTYGVISLPQEGSISARVLITTSANTTFIAPAVAAGIARSNPRRDMCAGLVCWEHVQQVWAPLFTSVRFSGNSAEAQQPEEEDALHLQAAYAELLWHVLAASSACIGLYLFCLRCYVSSNLQ